MAVIKADLAIGGRQIKGTFNGYYINNVGQWNIAGSVQYIAYCDKADESPVLLLQSPKLPQIGNLYVEGGKLQYRRRGWTTEKANTGYYCLERTATSSERRTTTAPRQTCPLSSTQTVCAGPAAQYWYSTLERPTRRILAACDYLIHSNSNRTAPRWRRFSFAAARFPEKTILKAPPGPDIGAACA